MKRFLFLLGLLLNAVWLPAQDTYRYLELVNDTAKRQEIRQRFHPIHRFATCITLHGEIISGCGDCRKMGIGSKPHFMR